jgi:cytochrome c oxidase subunit IV
MPIFNQEVLLSYWPIVVAFMILELGLLVYKFRVGKWTFPLAWTNAFIHTASIIVFFVFVGNANLYNSEVIPYFADIIETNAISVENTIKWIWWSMIITFVIAIAIEIYDSFRKAKM